jgi:hypothetical protein
MMNLDVNPSDEIYHDDMRGTSGAIQDHRLDRDLQNDLHLGIDLSFEFAKKLKELHPAAFAHIKGMIMGGKLI